MADTLAPNVTDTPLPGREEDAARLVAEDELSDEQIAVKVGIAKRTLERWKQRPAFSARVTQHQEAFKDRALSEGFADKRARLKALNTVATAVLAQLGQSQFQHVTFVTDDGAHVYGFDVPRLKEFRATLDDIAKEIGDRKTISETTHKFNPRQEAEAIAAEIGKPELVEQIHADLLISQEAR